MDSDDSSKSSNSSSSSSSDGSTKSIPSVSSSISNVGEFHSNLQKTVKKLKREWKNLQKKKKKSEKKSSEVIFRYLMKSVESFGLPSLNYNPDPSRQRGAYISFIKKLKLVLSTMKQTRKVLSSVNDVKEPKTHSANIALFCMICVRVHGYLRHQIQETQVSTGREDGYAALLLLRDLFADASDMDYQVHALNNFKTVMLKANETIFDFNKRFGLLYRNIVSSGAFLPKKDRIQYYW